MASTTSPFGFIATAADSEHQDDQDLSPAFAEASAGKREFFGDLFLVQFPHSVLAGNL